MPSVADQKRVPLTGLSRDVIKWNKFSVAETSRTFTSSSRMKNLKCGECFKSRFFPHQEKKKKVEGDGGNWLVLLFHFFFCSFIDHQWRFPPHLRLFFWQPAFEFRERDQGINSPSPFFFLSIRPPSTATTSTATTKIKTDEVGPNRTLFFPVFDRKRFGLVE